MTEISFEKALKLVEVCPNWKSSRITMRESPDFKLIHYYRKGYIDSLRITLNKNEEYTLDKKKNPVFEKTYENYLAVIDFNKFISYRSFQKLCQEDLWLVGMLSFSD